MAAIEGFRSPRSRLGVGAVVVVLLAALAVTVGIGIWRSTTTSVTETVLPHPAPAPTSAQTPVGELFVHVSGAVREPGLYVLEPGARVVDAIAAAGGFAEEADGSAVNLARPLADGEQLGVPVVGEAPPPGDRGGDAGSAGGGSAVVNVNAADQAELETLPRIGPALAQRILDWREQNGRFTAVEDLLAVPGIGEKMLEALRPLVTV